MEDKTETIKGHSAKIPLISISIPVYNEEANLDRLYDRLCAIAEKLSGKYELEFVFTDNHSDDKTWNILCAFAEKDTRIKAIRFSKNFGFQRSIQANYLHTKGDAVMQIDADMQDPPEMLEQFLEFWTQGYAVVYGIRRKRKEGSFLSIFRKAGYFVIDKLSEDPIPHNVGDFRLIDRKIIQNLEKFKIPNPYLRGTIASLGFRQIGIPYDRDSRMAGESKFPIRKVVQLGFAGVFNQSFMPLRFASYTGISFIVVSILGAIYYLALKIFQPSLPQGLASLHILILFGIGFQALLLGIIGEYLLRIYVVLRGDPIAIIEDSANISKPDLKL